MLRSCPACPKWSFLRTSVAGSSAIYPNEDLDEGLMKICVSWPASFAVELN